MTTTPIFDHTPHAQRVLNILADPPPTHEQFLARHGRVWLLPLVRQARPLTTTG